MYLPNIFRLFPLMLLVSAKNRHQHRSVVQTITETVGPASTDPSNTDLTPNCPAGSYTVIASRSGSSFDQLSLTASGNNFTLSNFGPATYCPEAMNDCPTGNVTAFIGYGGMDAEVPGGQLVYVTKGGRLGYTQAHSPSYPPGSILAPFSFTPAIDNSSVVVLSIDAFDAPSLMACATPGSSYQVFAAISNATVPSGNISACTSFSAITSGYGGPPVWQYI